MLQCVAAWLIHMCDLTHPYVWQDSFICVTCLIHMCHMTHSYVCHDSFICVPWLIHMCDMTHSYVWHDSFICVTWLIHMCDMTHSYVCHDSFICVSWLIHTCAMTYSYVSQDFEKRNIIYTNRQWYEPHDRNSQKSIFFFFGKIMRNLFVIVRWLILFKIRNTGMPVDLWAMDYFSAWIVTLKLNGTMDATFSEEITSKYCKVCVCVAV